MDILAPPTRMVTSAHWSSGPHVVILSVIDGRDLIVPDDPANSDRQAIQRWQDAGNTIEEAPPPPAAPVPETISDRQFFQQLAVQQVITQDEALAAVKTGAVPPALQTLISALPADQQFGAEMIVSGAVEFHRHSALVQEIAQAYGWNSEQVDALWRSASAL